MKNYLLINIAGEPCFPVLDAERGATEFRSSTADDPAMSETVKDIHSGSSYAKSRIRVVQRFQGDPIGAFDLSGSRFIFILLPFLLSGFDAADFTDVYFRELRRSALRRTFGSL